MIPRRRQINRTQTTTQETRPRISRSRTRPSSIVARPLPWRLAESRHHQTRKKRKRNPTNLVPGDRSGEARRSRPGTSSRGVFDTTKTPNQQNTNHDTRNTAENLSCSHPPFLDRGASAALAPRRIKAPSNTQKAKTKPKPSKRHNKPTPNINNTRNTTTPRQRIVVAEQ